MLRSLQFTLIFFIFVQFSNASGEGDEVKSKRKQFMEQHDDKVRDWKVFFKKMLEFSSDVIQTESGYETLTHMGKELNTIVDHNRGVFAKQFISEIRDIMLDEVAQKNIIQIANTIKEVLLIPDGYYRAITKLRLWLSISFNTPLIEAGHILFSGVQKIHQNNKLQPAYEAMFNKIISYHK